MLSSGRADVATPAGGAADHNYLLPLVAGEGSQDAILPQENCFLRPKVRTSGILQMGLP